MNQLSDFSSVFEISTALFLAYGLIKSAYSFPLIRIKEEIENAKGTLKEFGEDHPKSGLQSAIGLIERMYGLLRPDLDKLYIFLARISLALSILPISILIFSGFYKCLVSDAVIAILLALTLLPVPSFAFIAFFKSQKLVNDLSKVREILKKEGLEVLLVSQQKHSK